MFWLALHYKSFSKINPTTFKKKALSIAAMHWATFPFTERSHWDRAAQPSPTAGPQPAGPDLHSMAAAYTCSAMLDMQGSPHKGVFIITHMLPACFLTPSSQVEACNQSCGCLWMFSVILHSSSLYSSLKAVFWLFTGHRAESLHTHKATRMFKLPHKLFLLFDLKLEISSGHCSQRPSSGWLDD